VALAVPIAPQWD